MPLEHSKSPAAFRHNVSTLMKEVGVSPHVKSRAQALAISYATQRRGRAGGGAAPGSNAPLYQLVPVQNGSNQGVANPSAMPTNSAMPAPIAVGNSATTQSNPAVTPSNQNQTVGQLSIGGAAGAPSGPTQGVAGFFPGTPSGPISSASLYQITPINPQGPGQKSGGAVVHRWGGGFNMAQGPNLMPSWQEKQESRNMMHTGPIMSSVPGRTDRHSIMVPSSSYVFPSQHVASLGQGNTMAGFASLNRMFGPGGPYGSGAMKIGHGPGAPRPPRAPKFSDGGYSDGGGRGEGVGKPTPVIVAGGEYVLGPDEVRRVGKGSIRNGHRILDAWVMATRKREIETQKKLPEPAKR